MGERESLRLLLASGAEHKYRRLLASLNNLDPGREFNLRRVALGEGEIPEWNHVKEAPILYAAKARHAFEKLKPELEEGEYGISSDVHPKAGKPEKPFDQALVKNLELAELDPSGRLDAGVRQIERIFGQYETRELLMRIGVGIVAWSCPQGLIGMVASKAYIHFPINPLPDRSAARDYLLYCQETHRNMQGELDNLTLERSVAAPALILQESLVTWVLENRGRVTASMWTENPSREILQLVNGFTDEATKELTSLIIEHEERAGKNSRIWREQRVTYLPRWRHSLIFDRAENRVVVNNQVRINE